MNSKLSQQMSLLGLAAIICYALMLSVDLVSFEVMPQFVVSALIFFTSGRLMRKSQACAEDEEQSEQPSEKVRSEQDLNWLSLLLNWSMSLLILGLLALWLMKPLGVELAEAVKQTTAHESFFSGYVP